MDGGKKGESETKAEESLTGRFRQTARRMGQGMAKLTSKDPRRGDVWLADLDPVRGHEQAGRCPILVVSVDPFNQGPADLVIVLPITSRSRGIPAHVSLVPPEGGLRTASVILCDGIRSISKDRLVTRWGKVNPATLSDVEDAVRVLLGL